MGIHLFERIHFSCVHHARFSVLYINKDMRVQVMCYMYCPDQYGPLVSKPLVLRF